MEGVAGSLYERTGLTSAADMASFVIRSEINHQADRIRRLPGGDELVHYAGITWSLTRQQAAINAQSVRDWGQSAATSLAVWGGEGNGFAYWAGLTLGSYTEGGSNLVAALLVDPLSTAEGLAGAVEAHYRAGGALAVAGMFTGGLEIYESLIGADFLSGEAFNGDQRFDRSLAGISGITTIVGGSAILRHAAQHGARATLEMIVTAPKNVLMGAKPAFANSAAEPQLPILNPHFTPNQATLNKVTAFGFYRIEGGLSADDALMHMRGIDFSKQVSVVDVPYGTTSQQLTYPGGMGNYFSTMGETATRLGIVQGQRVPILFQSMGPTKALRSTTSSFVWPDGPTPGAGGAVQFYIPNKWVFTPIAR